MRRKHMNKIIELKKHRGLTNEDISQILAANHGYRYSRATISRWITGNRKCPEEVITVLAGPDLLDVDNEHLGELFDEVYSEKHPNPPDQMCIDDEYGNPLVHIEHVYMSYSTLCEMFEGQLPWGHLKLLLNGFGHKVDEQVRADVLTFTNQDWDRVLYPLWNYSNGQSSYNKVLLKLYDLGLYKLEEPNEQN
jgi:hypothetical protein